MSFHFRLNPCQETKTHFVVVIQSCYTASGMWASFELSKLTIEYDHIKIKGIEDYRTPSAERKFILLEDDEESGSESNFEEVDTACSNDLTESDSDIESD